jgi:hypothetical protein
MNGVERHVSQTLTKELQFLDQLPEWDFPNHWPHLLQTQSIQEDVLSVVFCIHFCWLTCEFIIGLLSTCLMLISGTKEKEKKTQASGTNPI